MALRLANQFSTDVIISTASPFSAAFGFDATHIRILNYAGVPMRLNLGSTGAASTGDPEIAAGEVFDLHGVVVTGLTMTTTSATTSTGADGHRVVINAWGGF